MAEDQTGPLDTQIDEIDDETLASLGSGSFGPVSSDGSGGSFGTRYEKGRRLGVGGMGEVLEYGDKRIGRRIALKVALEQRSGGKESRRRFVREALLQGQLEHPAIVPVYDFGRDDDGHLFFTMKRVDGVTLKDVLRGIAGGDEALTKRFSRRKLLSAFVTVCQAVDYAHSRGVVHRDLKPANIMLGRFGEVYVLDWGVAKLVGSVEEIVTDDGEAGDGMTRAGAFLGTPGYAAPEQVKGAVDARSDVYALGVILFEILAHEPLHEGGAVTRIMATADGVDARIQQRALERDVPPELEAACVRATSVSPDERFATVRELHETIEAFLEGESNLQLRRDLAEEHARSADQLTVRALGEGGSIGDRRQAMEEAGRCLALEPTNALATGTMMTLLTTQPAESPVEVEHELERVNLREVALSGRVAAFAYASFFLFIPLLMWQGVLAWTPIALIFGGYAVCAAITFSAARKPEFWKSLLALTVSNAVAGVASMLYGSLVLVPAIVAPNTLLYIIMNVRSKDRWVAFVTGTLAIIIPFVLEIASVLDPPYRFEGGAMTILPRAMSLPEAPTLTVLMLTSLACVGFSLVATAKLREQLVQARRQLLLQGWHLRALFPGASQRAEGQGTRV